MGAGDMTGSGPDLRRRRGHPYIGRVAVSTEAQVRAAVDALNKGRDNSRGHAVEVTYWFEVVHGGRPMDGLVHAARMVLEHGTLKPWHSEGDPSVRKPDGYDELMSWATDVQLLGRNPDEGVEAGLVTIAYPLRFFDTRPDGRFPLASFLMAAASEPFSAFSFYQGARIVDVRLPPQVLTRFPGQNWPHARVRKYLDIPADEPIIGTIVKPKTGLTPELFSRSVVQAALAGARFTKADENMHLALADVPRYVERVVKDLEAAGFDLGRSASPAGRRFLFAPHITTDPERLEEYARAAVDAGANALMFSPWHGGGFPLMAEISRRHDVPVYAHTAGMNLVTGSPAWGIDPRVAYLLAALSGAAFMQLTAVRGYLKPDDVEKGPILQALRAHGLEGTGGMTLAIAGGIGPSNIGVNMKELGTEGRMFLAGTSVYSHPDGPASGVKAIISAWNAFSSDGITDPAELKRWAAGRGSEASELLRALGQG